MKWILPILAIIFLPAPSAFASDTDQVADQFRAFCLQESTDHGQRLLDDVEIPTTSVDRTKQLLSTLKEDGSWLDIDYAVNARSSWPAADHLTRVLSIVVYARRSDTPPDDTKKCLAAIHRALAFWQAHDFKCPNWWYNDIGVPKMLGNVALLMEGALQPDELKYIADTVMARSKVGSMTGQNRVWLAGNGVMRAALNHDDALLKKAADVIASEIQVTTKEGIQPDWSFHQHGAQQQFGNYGMAFAVEMTKWATVLRGTPYAIPSDKLSAMTNYLLQGQNWITWHGQMDISSCGRQLFPGTQAKKAAVIRGVMRSMIAVSPEQAPAFTAFVERNTGEHPKDLVGDQLFWRSDYLMHRTPDWAVSLKMSSSRVIGGETVNDENLSGVHLADGATFIYRTGHEYDDIFPVWDWHKIPGTTVEQNDSLKWSGKTAHLKGDFVGGVSDGQSAGCAMDLRRDSMHAKKAWFFTPNYVVCLGADITSTGDDPVITTIDQCLSSGKVAMNDTELTSGSADLANFGWISHNNIKYLSLSPQPIKINVGPRTGNWRSVFENPSTPKADVTKNILTICIDHGPHPKAATYAYAITDAGIAPDQIHIQVTNLVTVQAARIGNDWSAAVFWSAGKTDLIGDSVAVDNPCVVLNDQHRIFVADPTEKLKAMQVTIAGKSQQIELPQGGEAGKSVAVR